MKILKVSKISPARFLLQSGLSICLLLAPAVQAADMSKTLRVHIPNSEGSFDPATAFEANTMSINENIFEPMLRYNYLVRPLRLEPNTLSAMPEVSSDGLTYTFKLSPGIWFTPDPAFQGKKRELTAADYAYSFKRLYDPVLKSPWAFLLEDSLQGDEALKAAAKAGKFSYELEIPGLRVLDKYTLQLKLKRPNNNFLYLLAIPATSAVAREVIEAHPKDPGSHPVGTGPYQIKEWQRSNRILLSANPDYRPLEYTWKPGEKLQDEKIAASLKGKRLPLIGQVEVKVVEEHQTIVLGFLGKQFDYVEEVPRPITDMVVRDGKLKPELAAQGIKLVLFPRSQTEFMWMNMQDPVLGGYTPEKIALRRAIALSYDRSEDIRVHNKQLGLPALGMAPPAVIGYDPDLPEYVRHDPRLARALLDKFGYKDRDGDGYRELPDGKPLHLTMHSRANATGRVYDERWRKAMESIGVKISFKSDKYTEIIKASRLGKVQMFEFGWVADFPDATNYFQLLYGPNIGISNDARFDLPEFNQLYEASLKLHDGPERTALFRKMNQLLAAYAPWVLRLHPLMADVQHPWLRNYARHPVDNTTWRYLDLDLPQREKALKSAG